MNILLIETKKEYTKSLCRFVTPQIYRGIKSIFEDASKLCYKNKSEILKTFQKLLEEIPKWNSDILSIEYDRIVRDSNCNYLDDLITAVFVCYTKVLAAVQCGTSTSKIDLQVPNSIDFIHKCYIESARSFWKQPYLLKTNVSTIDYQKNLDKSQEIISKSIESTIHNLLPIEAIVQQYVKNKIEPEDNVSVTSDAFNANLQEILKNDMKDINKDKNYISIDSPLDKYIKSDCDMFDTNNTLTTVEKSVSLNTNKNEMNTSTDSPPGEQQNVVRETVKSFVQQVPVTVEVEETKQVSQQVPVTVEVEETKQVSQQVPVTVEVEEIKQVSQQVPVTVEVEETKQVSQQVPVTVEVEETKQVSQQVPVTVDVEETTQVSQQVPVTVDVEETKQVSQQVPVTVDVEETTQVSQQAPVTVDVEETKQVSQQAPVTVDVVKTSQVQEMVSTKANTEENTVENTDESNAIILFDNAIEYEK